MHLLIGMYCVNVTLLSSPQGGKLNKSKHGAIRLIRTGRWEERGYGSGGRGRVYTYRYAVTTRVTPALRWAEIRAILMLNNYCEGQSDKQVSTDHNSEEKGEPKEIRTEVPLLTSLTPYR